MTPFRSVPWTVFFSIIVLGGVVLGVVVFVDPDATIEAMSGTRRSGYAVLGAFGAPFVLVALGVVGLIWWCQRWRSPAGGRLKVATRINFSDVDSNLAWHVLETARSEDDPNLIALFEQIKAEPTRAGYPLHQIEVRHDAAGKYAVVIVVRNFLTKPKDPAAGTRGQLERPPLVRQGENYIDFKRAYAPYVLS